MAFMVVSNLNGVLRYSGSGSYEGPASPVGVAVINEIYPVVASDGYSGPLKVSGQTLVPATPEEVAADAAQFAIDRKKEARAADRANLKRHARTIEFVRRMVNETPPVTRNRAERIMENVLDSLADDED